jgi:hypothetical protein
MSKLHILSEQQLGASEGDQITIVLVEPTGQPSSVVINWPPASTRINPRDFGDLAALLTRTFARAAVKLSRIKKSRRK